jgi:hypothetical protein
VLGHELAAASSVPPSMRGPPWRTSRGNRRCSRRAAGAKRSASSVVPAGHEADRALGKNACLRDESRRDGGRRPPLGAGGRERHRDARAPSRALQQRRRRTGSVRLVEKRREGDPVGGGTSPPSASRTSGTPGGGARLSARGLAAAPRYFWTSAQSTPGRRPAGLRIDTCLAAAAAASESRLRVSEGHRPDGTGDVAAPTSSASRSGTGEFRGRLRRLPQRTSTEAEDGPVGNEVRRAERMSSRRACSHGPASSARSEARLAEQSTMASPPPRRWGGAIRGRRRAARRHQPRPGIRLLGSPVPATRGVTLTGHRTQPADRTCMAEAALEESLPRSGAADVPCRTVEMRVKRATRRGPRLVGAPRRSWPRGPIMGSAPAISHASA